MTGVHHADRRTLRSANTVSAPVRVGLVNMWKRFQMPGHRKLGMFGESKGLRRSSWRPEWAPV
jgi:hypothetical protein